VVSVKICGIRRVEDALVAADAGAAMLGFVFAPSRRRIALEDARDIIAEVRRRHPEAKSVGVFVDASKEEMNHAVRFCDLDLVQLSGSRSNEMIDGLDAPAIEVLHVGPETQAEALAGRAFETSARMLLLDTARAGEYGGTGETFDWSLIPDLHRDFLLAGGLTADNVHTALDTVKPWGVDVSSGVERNGAKDQQMIREFISACRRHSGQYT